MGALNVPDDARRSARRLVFLCSLVYFCSYLTRLNYSAVLVEMISGGGFSRAGASAAVTGLFITYAVGQLISGYLGDRIPAELLIFFGLAAAGVLNIALPFCPDALWLTVVWSLNGFAQAMLWPPLVKILSSLLPEEAYGRAVVCVSWGSALGSVMVYLLTSAFLAAGSWKLAFFVPAGMALAAAVLWMRGYPVLAKRLGGAHDLDRRIRTAAAIPAAGGVPLRYAGLLAVIMLAIICQGLLRDGISTWMPTYVTETFHLENSVSVLSAVILPLLNLGIYHITLWLHRSFFPNELTCAGVIFSFGAVCLLILRSLCAGSVWLAAGFLALGSVSMHGVNLMLISLVPAAFRRFKRTSLVSGILNACTYIGSSVSAYGLAEFSAHRGWTAVQTLWLVIGFLGAAFCFACVTAWRRFRREDETSKSSVG